ncbi:MAG: hypothetical protein WD749_10775 [Phycisphaerales bacterium]
MSGMAIQTGALFLDAYRELNARKLFWITLAISGVVVAAFAAVGLSPAGLTILWWEIPNDWANSKNIAPAVLYKFAFATMGIPIWLAWIATILGLVSTASIIPEFIAGGSIELTLSKPIGRMRLFLTKYVTALLFAALQVTVFSVAVFLLIGIRGSVWEPRVFLAIPLIVIFFSYLYCVCALLGLLTRSTIAALLLTLLVWFVFFGVHTTEQVFLMLRETSTLKIGRAEGMIEQLKAQQTRQEAELVAAREEDAGSVRTTAAVNALDGTGQAIGRRTQQLEDIRGTAGWMETTHRYVFYVKTALPKTAETVELLERSLLSTEDYDRFRPRQEPPPFSLTGDDIKISQRALEKRLIEVLRERSVAWVIGTSLLFELLVVLVTLRIFARRDF